MPAPKSAPPPSVDEFWKLLVASGLVDAGAAAELRRESADITGRKADDELTALARWLAGRGVITRWQAKRLVTRDPRPFFIADYRLLERIDCEGDGQLFEARNEPSGRIVSLMLLSTSRCKQLDVWSEIVRRTKAAHQAVDPLLSRTWMLEQHESSRFIICERIQGAKLADELQRLGPLPRAQAGVVVLQVARAVAELHALGSVHGDLSLDVLCREPVPAGGAERNGRVRLLQFPLSGDPHRVPLRLPAGDQDRAALGQRACFVAPELLLPNAECSPCTDVYAIGAILFTLLTGTPPCWTGDALRSLSVAAARGPEALGTLGVPADMAALVGRLMARDPAARCASAAAAAAAVEACLGLAPAPVQRPAPVPAQVTAPVAAQSRAPASGHPVATRGPVSPTSSPRGQPVPPERRPRSAVGPVAVAGGCALAAVLAALGFLIFTAGQREKTTPAAPLAGDDAAARQPKPPSRPPQTAVVDRPKPPDALDRVAAAPRAAEPAAEVRQVVVVDEKLPWESPTTGGPPELRHLPAGSQLVLVARLADMAADDEGRLFLKALGPAAAALLQSVATLCGAEPAGIEILQAGWQADAAADIVGGYAVRLAADGRVPAAPEARAAAWGTTTPRKVGTETVHDGADLSFWVPAAGKGRELVFGPRSVVDGIVEQASGPAGVLPALEPLLPMLDGSRHVTLFGSPHYLLNAGRPLLVGALHKLAAPLDALLGDSLQAAALSLHFGGDFYVELDAVPTRDAPSLKQAPALAGRVDGLAAEVERYCSGLDPDPYGRLLVIRLPAMVRALAGQLRHGAERGGIVLNARLPRHAGHNLALAAELALAQAGGTAPAAAAGPAPAQGALAKLRTTMTLTFAKDTLEKSIQMISEEIGVPMEILGGDLQLEGITKNQSFGIDERDKPAEAILRVILAKANPDGKLVYVVRSEEGREAIKITTRAAVAKRGETLPPGFEPREAAGAKPGGQ